MLFKNFNLFGSQTAIILEDGTQLSYNELQVEVELIKDKLGGSRKLVFIETNNNLTSIVCYLACMQSDKPVLLLNAENKAQNKEMIDFYQPNVVIDASNETAEINVTNESLIDLHTDLSLLLATSGSTGSPKLVMLSKENIKSNTESICEYLKLTNQDRAITSLKLNYSYGLSIVNTHLHVGASIVLTDKSITESDFFLLFSRCNVTSFSGVPYSFQLLEKQNINLYQYSSLRYVTQAGGKLESSLVKKNVLRANKASVDFFVMYGQTEASPRISYLPPEFAYEYSEYIGIALNNGELALLDQNGCHIEKENVEGELIYRGPNVMMGYALHRDELYKTDKIDWLKTGDIAIRNSQNLYKIVGRSSRFVKPYGMRINLDDIEMYLSKKGLIAAVTGVDEGIYISICKDSSQSFFADELLQELVELYKLTLDVFHINFIDEIAQLSNGKIDYQKLKETCIKKDKKESILSVFLKTFLNDFSKNMLLSSQKSLSILSIYKEAFINQSITLSSSFASLSGDSLSYVIISTEIEQYLGYLPLDWHVKSISELENLKQAAGM